MIQSKEQLGLFPLTFQELRRIEWEESQWAEGITCAKVNRRRVVYPPMAYQFGSEADVVGWMRNQFHRGFERVKNPTEPFEYAMAKVGDLKYEITVCEWSDW
jgi:hypothetical protein